MMTYGKDQTLNILSKRSSFKVWLLNLTKERHRRFLQVCLPPVDFYKEQSYDPPRVVDVLCQRSAKLRSRGVYRGLYSFEHLNALHVQNVPLTYLIAYGIVKMKKLKALIVAFHPESSYLLTKSSWQDLNMVTSGLLDLMPPLESLRLLYPTPRVTSLAASVNKTLQHLYIQRRCPQDDDAVNQLLAKTRFPNLRHFTLIGSAPPENCMYRFVSRHRKTLQEFNIEWSNALLGHIRWILRILKALSGDFSVLEDEDKGGEYELYDHDPEWFGFAVYGFGCAFQDRQGGEGRELVELGLRLERVPLELEPFQLMFKDNVFRTLQRLKLILQAQLYPGLTVERHLVSYPDE